MQDQKKVAITGDYQQIVGTPWVIDRRTNEQFNIGDTDVKIALYENRVRTWFLDVAEYLNKRDKATLRDGREFSTNEAGFVILMIAVAYVESNQQYREGSSSREHPCRFFNRGLRRILAEEKHPNKVIDSFYGLVRCGLFHNSMTKPTVGLNGNLPSALVQVGNVLVVNPHKFFHRVEADFNSYIAGLKNKKNTRSRAKFQATFDLMG